MTNAIILTGIKHSGKSTLGRLLANRMSCAFYDTDDEITRQTGFSPREIFLKSGTDGFLQAEVNACQHIATLPDECAVIATGGGICNNPKAFNVLRGTGTIVYLSIAEEIAAARILAEITENCGTLENVPAYIAREKPQTTEDVRRIFHCFYEERVPRYLQFADIVFMPENAPPEQNVEKLLRLF